MAKDDEKIRYDPYRRRSGRYDPARDGLTYKPERLHSVGQSENNIKDLLFSQEVNTKLQDLGDKAQSLERQTDEHFKDLEDKFDKKTDRLNEQLKADRLQSIQILTLFVAFFTFVSVEFQLFSSLKDDLSVAALSLLLCGSLLLFVAPVLMLSNTKGKTVGRKSIFSKMQMPGLVLVIALILLIVSTFIFGYVKYEAIRNESSHKKQKDVYVAKCIDIETSILNQELSAESIQRLTSLYEILKCSDKQKE